MISTWMDDCLGTPRAVGNFLPNGPQFGGRLRLNCNDHKARKKKKNNKKSDSLSFSGPNKVRYHELEQKVIQYYVQEKRNEGLPTTQEG